MFLALVLCMYISPNPYTTSTVKAPLWRCKNRCNWQKWHLSFHPLLLSWSPQEDSQYYQHVHLLAYDQFAHNKLYLSFIVIEAYHFPPYRHHQLSSTFYLWQQITHCRYSWREWYFGSFRTWSQRGYVIMICQSSVIIIIIVVHGHWQLMWAILLAIWLTTETSYLNLYLILMHINPFDAQHISSTSPSCQVLI